MREQNKNLSRLTILILVCLIPGLILAQDMGSIAGSVVDIKSGKPLAGANVYAKGALIGASTDADGFFLIKNVPMGDYILVAEYIGYYNSEKALIISSNEQAKVSFELSVSILELDAIVVTGTGTGVRKKELTTSISTISAAQIEAAPVESIDQLLQGRISGGQISTNSGMPGTGSRVRLRGITSANSSQTPVIYLDGIRLDNNDNFRLEQGTGGVAQNSLSDILVSDIERVEVIKGGAAATLYGSEAANGIIQIFTKKGYIGEPHLTFKVEQGFNAPETKYVLEDLTKDHILEDGHYQKYALTLTGGSSLLTYHLSGFLMGNDGVLPEDFNKQYSFRAGMQLFPGDDWQVKFSGGLVRDSYERMYNNNASVDLYGSVEQHSPDFFGDGLTEDQAVAKIREYALPDINYNVNRFNIGATAEYDPGNIFSSRFTMGVDYRKNEERQFVPIAAAEVTGIDGGGLFRSDREYLTLTLDYAGTVRYPKSRDFSSTFTFGAQGFRVEDRESNVSATEFGLPGTDDFDNTANQTPLESNREVFNGGIYINEQLGYKEKLFFSAGLRVDGNTTFGDKVKSVAYPKFGLAYNITQESFWSGVFKETLNHLKFRVSYGETGNFPAPFTRDKTFLQGPFLDAVAANFGNPGNEDLEPERTKTIEFGVETSLLNERIGLEFNYFTETTDKALFLAPEQPSTGLGNQLRNVGSIENSGIELSVDAKVLAMSDFDVSIWGTYFSVDNEVTDLGDSQPFSIAGFAFLPQRIEVGKPVGIFRTNIPNDDGSFNTVLEKSPLPDFSYSFGITARLYKNWRVLIMGDGQSGGYSANLGKILRFLNGGEVKGEQIPAGHNFVTASDIFIEDATFFKLREISVSYQFPQSYFGAQISLVASIRNVFILSKAKDFDPELSGARTGSVTGVDVGGININTISPPHQFRLTLQMGY
jgi:TonB-dependent SusC/RagA subfamily outer membrane receptor